MEKYSSYKDSGVQWLGEIPSHWSLRKMKYAFVERSQKGFPKEPLLAATQSYGVIKKADYEVRTVEALKNLRTLKLVEIGDFVISLRSFQGGIEYSHCRGIISPAYTILTPTHITADYFKYLGKSSIFINLLKSTVTGIREGQNIDYNKLKSEYMPIPPIEEQQSMASYLDKATAEIDKAIAQQQHMIDLLNERKQIIIQRAVTKGLDENVEMKDSGVEWIGDIPAHWDTRAIKSVTQMILGKMLSSQGNNFAQSSPYICAKDVHFGSIDITDLKRMYFTNLEKERYAVREGDLLIVEGGAGAGGCAVMEKMQETIYMQNSIIAIRPKKDICNSYISYIIESYVKRGYIEYVCNKATIPHFTKEKVGATYIPIPPLEEQKHIVFHLNEVIKKFNDAICRHRQMIDLLRERKQIIISEVVTGKIKVS